MVSVISTLLAATECYGTTDFDVDFAAFSETPSSNALLSASSEHSEATGESAAKPIFFLRALRWLFADESLREGNSKSISSMARSVRLTETSCALAIADDFYPFFPDSVTTLSQYF